MNWSCKTIHLIIYDQISTSSCIYPNYKSSLDPWQHTRSLEYHRKILIEESKMSSWNSLRCKTSYPFLRMCANTWKHLAAISFLCKNFFKTPSSSNYQISSVSFLFMLLHYTAKPNTYFPLNKKNKWIVEVLKALPLKLKKNEASRYQRQKYIFKGRYLTQNVLYDKASRNPRNIVLLQKSNLR